MFGLITSMLKCDGFCYYEKTRIKTTEENFTELWNLHPEEKKEIMMNGKLIKVPRYHEVYGTDYKFSGVEHKGIKFPKLIKKLLKSCNTLLPVIDCGRFSDYKFNQGVVNWYEDGNNYIGAHRDNEKCIVEKSPILSISLGETRTFRIREHKTKEIIEDVKLENNDVLIMCQEFQKYLTHEIVKISGKKANKTGKRISLTFRITK